MVWSFDVSGSVLKCHVLLQNPHEEKKRKSGKLGISIHCLRGSGKWGFYIRMISS